MTIEIKPTNASPAGFQNMRRVYTWADRKLPSVTTYPKLAGMPDRLHRWLVGNLIDYVVANASDISLRAATGDEREIKALRSALWSAVQGDQNGRIVGIAVHRAAAEGHRPEDVHPQIAPKLRQYLDWIEQSKAEILGAEFQVFNLTEGYGGTVDLLVRFADGSIWLVDIKTGRGLYGEHGLQLVAYLMAEFVGENDIVNVELTDLLHQVSGVGILHLGESDWEFVKLGLSEQAWLAYRGLIRYVAWMEANRDLDRLALVRRWSDGRTTDMVQAAQRPDVLSELGWHWAQMGVNLAHFVPPNGDMSLCMRPVERTRRVDLLARPEKHCSRCAFRLAGDGTS